MSNWLVAIIMFGTGAFFGLICMAVVACNTRVEAEKAAYNDGYKAGIRRMSVMRVDIAPGVDSIRTEVTK